jgi:putative membrane protein
MRALASASAIALLLGGWTAALQLGGFAAHMSAHVTAVSLAAPLLVLGISRRPPWLQTPMAALAASAVELVVVWGWHLPALHAAARASIGMFAFEHLMFLLAGYGVWASALPPPEQGRGTFAALAGVGALLVTSMHMTLLGGLLTISSQPWYHHGTGGDALWDQQLGGVIMLSVGGLAYLGGALVVLARALNVAPDWRDQR